MHFSHEYNILNKRSFYHWLICHCHWFVIDHTRSDYITMRGLYLDWIFTALEVCRQFTVFFSAVVLHFETEIDPIVNFELLFNFMKKNELRNMKRNQRN